MHPPIQVLICEDDVKFMEVLASFLAREADIDIAGMASCREELLELLTKTRADVLLLDLNLSGNAYDGIEAALEMQKIAPDMKTIVLSGLDQEEIVSHAMVVGRATNYVVKDYYRDIPDAIRAAFHNQSGIHHSSAQKMVNQYVKANIEDVRRRLSPNQINILRLLSQGLDKKAIAERLFYNEQTISNELYKIAAVLKGKFPYLEKLRLKKQNTAEIVELARQLDIIS